MKIGLTYDLRQDYLLNGMTEEETAEFDKADTIDAIERALREFGAETDRIGNIRSLTQRLTIGERWDLVFNIAEGLHGFGREAQVPALLDAYDIPYTFSDPLTLSLTLHKGMAKRVARDAGIPTPDFRTVENEADALMVDLPFPLFVKPVAEGTGKGVSASSIVRTRKRLVSATRDLFLKYGQPVLVETFLPGREFTVGIVGTAKDAAAIGTMEVLFKKNAGPRVYSYENKEEWKKYIEYRVVDGQEAAEAAKVALDVWRVLGCRDAGRVDLRSDANGRPNFMEVNPLAGLHPEHSDLCILASKIGMPYRTLIHAIVTSALSRCTAGRMAYAGSSNWDNS
jgi:D-alanine-D-alanine ligase